MTASDHPVQLDASLARLPGMRHGRMPQNVTLWQGVDSVLHEFRCKVDASANRINFSKSTSPVKPRLIRLLLEVYHKVPSGWRHLDGGSGSAIRDGCFRATRVRLKVFAYCML